ncbi:cysteine hydrolase, partial [Lactobacillus sp. XV13L]|nr:cysteine hydrolase [Lactobacillus sp. XV13L]
MEIVMKQNILLVIDVQVGTMRFLWGKQEFLKRINSLIKDFRDRRQPIIFVKQAHQGTFYPGLNVQEDDMVFMKKHPSAFTVPKFAQQLQQLQPDKLVVTGLMSNAGVQATTVSALKNNYAVVLVE